MKSARRELYLRSSRGKAQELIRAGQAAARAGHRLPAYRSFVQACELDPWNPDAWLWRAGTAVSTDEAIRCLERVLALDPRNLRARLGLAELRAPSASSNVRAGERRPRRQPAGRRFLYAPASVLIGAAVVRLAVAVHAGGAEQVGTRPLVAMSAREPEGPSLTLLEATVSRGPGPPMVDDMSESSRLMPPAGVEPPTQRAFEGAGAERVENSGTVVAGATVEHAVPTPVAQPAPGPVTGRADQPVESATVARPPVQPQAVVGAPKPARRQTVLTPPEPVRQQPEVAPLEGGQQQEVAATPELLPTRPPHDTSPSTIPKGQIGSGALANQMLDAPDRSRSKTSEKKARDNGGSRAADSPPAPKSRPPRPAADQPWVAVHRATALWSGQDAAAVRFRPVAPGERFQVARPQDGPRLYVWDPGAENYAYIDASAVGPATAPALEPEPREQQATGERGEAEPAAPPAGRPWVAVHRETGLWSGPDGQARLFRLARRGEHFQMARPQDGPRLYVWDPQARNYAYVDAVDVGPAERPAEPPRQIPTTPQRLPLWSGTARVTMYTCVELGGCNRTAMGIWPYEGVVAVDPRIIPLGSEVWLEGLGTFLAADTGSAIYGNRIDVFVHDYQRAIQWGVRYLNAAAYARR